MKLIQVYNEIKVNKPTGKFRSNSELFKFLNNNIKELAESVISDSAVLTQYQQTLDDNNEYKDWEPNDAVEHDEYPEDLKIGLINFLVEKGLEDFGEWENEDDDTNSYGISWNIEIGTIYNWTDKADPGSYDWDEITIKGRTFYQLNFNL